MFDESKQYDSMHEILQLSMEPIQETKPVASTEKIEKKTQDNAKSENKIPSITSDYLSSLSDSDQEFLDSMIQNMENTPGL